MSQFFPTSQMYTFPVENALNVTGIPGMHAEQPVIVTSQPRKRRNFNRNLSPCESCSTRRVRCIYVRHPAEGVAPLCVACQKKNMTECGPYVSKKKNKTKAESSASVAKPIETPADSPLHSPQAPIIPVEEEYFRPFHTDNYLPNVPNEQGAAMSGDNDMLSLFPDDAIWQWYLSTYTASTGPPSLNMMQGYAPAGQGSMHDQRVSDAFATDELLNALPQFIEPQNSGSQAYTNNRGLWWWPSEGAGQMG